MIMFGCDWCGDSEDLQYDGEKTLCKSCRGETSSED